MALARFNVNQRAPSGPAVMAEGNMPVSGKTNSVIRPSVVMRPMRSVLVSVNQSAASGPTVMPNGPLPGWGSGKAVSFPSVVMRAIW
jgi:hypothetical protein